jgi:micrococcal nuclease
MDLFTYRVETVKRVVDGDTLELLIDLGFHTFRAEKIRLALLNCPELSTPAGKEAKRYAELWLTCAGRDLAIQTIRDKREKYGRYLGILHDLSSQTTLNQDLLENGHATPYTT